LTGNFQNWSKLNVL